MAPQQRALETRDRILDAAIECFSRSGFEAASVADICTLAGVTKGAFYHHFPSKQTLFLELLNRWLSDLEVRFADLRAEAADVPEALTRMACLAPAVFEVAGGRIPLYLEFWTQASRDPHVWQATIAPYRRYRGFFADLIRSGIEEGSLRPVDPQVAAHWLVSLAVGLLLQGALDPEGADWGGIAQDGMRVFLDALGRQRS